jgi:hypothetical protein
MELRSVVDTVFGGVELESLTQCVCIRFNMDGVTCMERSHMELKESHGLPNAVL